MKCSRLALLLVLALAACARSGDQASDQASGQCIEIVLTGTQGGPPVVNGLAGAGTLVRYGGADSACSDVLLQFDVGRGTTERLSQLGLSPLSIDAVFLTHMHSDHTEGLAGLLQYRWHFLGGPIDIVCSADATGGPSAGHTMSCSGLVTHTADAMLHSGEIAQRHVESNKRDPAGPTALARLHEIWQPLPDKPGTVVWRSGDVSVSAIGTVHIPGSLAYRVDTPAGSVVIGGDAGNSKSSPPRSSSSSEAVELLADGADILVHSVIHPAFAPGAESTFPPRAYLRQSTAADLGAMAERAGVRHLVLTHLIPAVDSATHGPYAVPGKPLVASDYENEALAGGYTGTIHVGEDLLRLRLPDSGQNNVR